MACIFAYKKHIGSDSKKCSQQFKAELRRLCDAAIEETTKGEKRRRLEGQTEDAYLLLDLLDRFLYPAVRGRLPNRGVS